MRKGLFAFLAASALAAVAVPAAAGASSAPGGGAGTARYIVRFNEGTDAPGQAAAFARNGWKVNFVYTEVFPGAAVEVPVGAVNGLAHHPAVASIELDGIVTASDEQVAPPSWGLDRIDQVAKLTPDNDGLYSYPSAGGRDVTVYVIDTGVDAAHTDFGSRVSGGFDTVDGADPDDCNGHGTHVAGTIAGNIYGVAKQATIVPVRVLNCSGSGSWSGVIAGLDWVVSEHSAGAPAVANMSLGGNASSSVDAAVQRVIGDGVTMAVAAGNSKADACRFSPARVPAAITVGATTIADARASYSNYGRCLDLFAPGSGITSAWIGVGSDDSNTISGTSMASPHVAGAAAVYLSQYPQAAPAEVSANLINRSTKNVVTSSGRNSPNRLLFSPPTA